MSDWAPYGSSAVFSDAYGQQLRRQVKQVRTGMQRRRMTNNVIFDQARQATSQYRLDLGEVAQRSAQHFGHDAGDFLTNPSWYQSMVENPAPLPDTPAFLGRMKARIHDGTVMAQMGRVGSNVLYGTMDRETALEEIEKLRGSMTDMEWLRHAKGIGPWVERQLGTALEAGAMQVDILFNEAGVGALAGIALASPGGPPAMAAAGRIGTTLGFAGGNVRVMQGLAYIDLLQHEIETQDGQRIPMPEDIARSAAKTIGAINGAIEFVQWRMAGPMGANVVRSVRRLTDRALRRMMVDGTFRSIVGRAALHGGVVGGSEVGQEVAQEVASAIGSHVALELAESDVGGVRVDGQPLGQAIQEAVMNTLAVGPGIALLALPGTIGAVRSGYRARASVAQQPEALFDRTEPHQTTPIGDLPVSQPTPRQRLAAEEAVRQAQETGTLPSIPVERTPDGTPIVTEPDAQAVVEVLRTHGAQRVPTAPAAGSPEAEQAAAAAEPTVAPRPAPVDGEEIMVRDPSAFDELRTYLREALPEGVSDEQIIAAAVTAENFTARANLTLREWLDLRFPAGVAADPDTAEQLLAGTYRRQQQAEAEPAPAPDEDAEREQRYTEFLRRATEARDARAEEHEQWLDDIEETVRAEPAGTPTVDERNRHAAAFGMVRPQEEAPRRYLRPRRQTTALPPPTAQPQVSAVDPVRLELPEVAEGEDLASLGSAIVAWESPEGTLQVVGGASRARIVQAMASEGAPFETPVHVLRAADGVTFEQAQQLGPELANSAGASVVDVAASLRGMPIDRLLSATGNLTDRRTRQALGLSMLADDAWDVVETGRVSPEHAAWVGVLGSGDADLQARLVESFVATPPATEFEAEVRTRRRALSPEEIRGARIMAMAKVGAAGDLFARAQRLADRGNPLHTGAVREHLSRQEIYGRALLWWTSEATGAWSYVAELAEGDQEVDAAAEDLLRYLRDNLTAAEEDAATISLGLVLTPEQAEANFERQQELMRRTPSDIGRARREGTLTAAHERTLAELEELRRELPQESEQWQTIFRQRRDRYDADLAAQRAEQRAETERRMVDGGWNVGDKVWLPERNMLTGQVVRAKQGTVKINKAGLAYVAGDGKRFDLFENRWDRVGEPAATTQPGLFSGTIEQPSGTIEQPSGTIEPDVDLTAAEAHRKQMAWREFGWKPGEQVRRVSGDVVFEGEVADRNGHPAVRVSAVTVRGEAVPDHALIGELIGVDPEDRWSAPAPFAPPEPQPTRVETTADGREMVTRQPQYPEGKAAGIEHAPGRGGRRGRVTKWGVRLPAETVTKKLEPGDVLKVTTRAGQTWYTRYAATEGFDRQGNYLVRTDDSRMETPPAEAIEPDAATTEPEPSVPPPAAEPTVSPQETAAQEKEALRKAFNQAEGIDQPAAAEPGEPRVTWKKARIILTPEGVKTAQIEPEPEAKDTGLEPKPAPEIRIEDASAEDIVNALLDLEQDNEPTNILFQDRPEIASKRLRLARELILRLMWDEGRHTFPDFANRFMEIVGSRPGAEALRGRLRDWYELARDIAPTWVGEMSTPEQVGQWYEGGTDVRADRDDSAPGEEPGGVRPVGAERGADPVPSEPERERAERVPPADRGEPEPELQGDREGAGDRDDRGAGVAADEPAARGERRADAGTVPAVSNWSFAPGSLTATELRRPVEKARDNVTAIETMQQVRREGRQPTPAEQKLLASYVGWGGLSGAFPDSRGRFKKEFRTAGLRLQELLSESEYELARRSIQYAHYTSEAAISGMWKLAQGLGFNGGNVLDPGAGIGHFGGLMPRDVAGRAAYLGVELDPVTAGIARMLYPEWSVRTSDYSKMRLADNTFALSIGNPPFGNITIGDDRKYAQHKFLLHDYFFAKSIDATRPGGLMVFISSAGTMNKADAKAREYLAERADFLGGIRLPNIAFKRNAGTEVTTDILTFRKRQPDAEPNHVAPWTATVEREMVDRNGNPATGRVNEYFDANPGQVLGEAGMFDELVAGLRYGVRPTEGMTADTLGADIDAAADRLIAASPSKPLAGDRDVEAPAPVDDDLGLAEDEGKPKKEGAFHIAKNGDLMQLRDDRLQPAMRKGGDGKYVKLNKADVGRVRALIPIRDAYRLVLSADLAGDTEAASAARAELGTAYDAFVAKYGPITAMTVTERKPTRVDQEGERRKQRDQAAARGEPFDEGTFDDYALLHPTGEKARPAGVRDVARARQEARDQAAARGEPFDEGSFNPETMKPKVRETLTNLFPFLADPESYRLLALEEGYDLNTNTALKGAVFTRPIVRPPREAQIETAEDAMLHIIGATGGFDADAAAAAWGRSTRELVDELGELVFFDPQGDTWAMAEEYLSGDVVTKLAAAREQLPSDPTLGRNVEALEAVQPDPVPQSKIGVELGAPWLPKATIKAFAEEVMLLKRVGIAHSDAVGQWGVESQGSTYNRESNTLYGVNRGIEQLRTSVDVLRAALNQRPLKAPRIRDGVKTYPDVEGDRLAVEAVDKIKTDFREWLWRDPDRAAEMSRIYNDKYNREVPRQYRSDYIKTPGVREEWEWYDHQKRGIARIIVSGNTYLNHSVGAGKTSTMIASAMEMKRLGLVHRPLFSVPNHVLSHFAGEWYHLYPEAKILVADEWNFHKARRQRFIAEAASGDYDAIIMSHSSFNMIGVSDDFLRGIINEQLSDFREAVSALDDDDRYTRKQLENAMEQLDRRLTAMDEAPSDDVLTFEEIGADALFVDEAHEYRNLAYATSQQLKGLDPTGNQKTLRMYAKTRYLDTISPGRGVVYASGTPVTNSLAEIWTLQRYLDHSGLQEYSLQSFDAWAGTFGQIENDLEPDVAGGYRYQDRFSKLKNQYQLYKLMVRFMDVVTPAQLRESVVIPEIAGGEREQIYVDAAPSQEEYFEIIKKRMQAIRGGGVKPKDDNPLKLTTEGRQAAMDMRLLPGYSGVQERTKVELMLDNVFEIWRDSTNQPFYAIDKVNNKYSDEPTEHGPATQMIFSPYGYQPGGDRLYLPAYVKAQLTARGVPEQEIAYIGDYDTLARKEQLFKDMNSGRIRILMGSEQGMGTGVNAQDRLVALHALGPLWHPAGDEQRVGRILRQGNLNREVRILDYSTIGSFDTAMWDLMRRKARGIEQFYRGDPDMEFIEDVSQANMYQTASAMTTYDPRAMRLAELQQQIEKLTRSIGAASRSKDNAESAAQAARRRIIDQTERAASLRIDLEQRRDTAGDAFSLSFEGQTYSERGPGSEALQQLETLVTKTRVFRTTKGHHVAAKWNAETQDWDVISKPTTLFPTAAAAATAAEHRLARNDERDVGRYAGFTISLKAVRESVGAVAIGRPDSDRPIAVVELNQKGQILAKLDRAVRDMDQRLRETEAEIEKLKTQAERMDVEAAKELPSRRELDTMIVEAEGLEKALAAEQEAAETAQAQSQEGPQEPERLITDDDVLHQLRRAAPGGELASQLTQELVERYGTTEDPRQAGLVLWDGRMLRNPPQDSRMNVAKVMQQADAIRMDGPAITAEGPLSDEQIATVLKHSSGRYGFASHRLTLTHHGRSTTTMVTSGPLNADTLRAFFARSPAPDPQARRERTAQEEGETMARGATMFDDAGAAVMAFAPDADFDTLMEELMHVYRRDLPKDMEDVVAPWSGAQRLPDGSWRWTRDAEEAFARGGVQFLREDGRQPPDAVRAVFERVAEWLRQLYSGLRTAMTPDVRSAYEDLLFGKGRPEVLAFERMQQAMDGRDRGEFTDGTDRVIVQRAGPGWMVDRVNEDDEREARRRHEDLEAALQDVAGLPTPNIPVPIGNARFRERTSDTEAPAPKNVEADLATDSMTLDGLAVDDTEPAPSGSELQVDPTRLLMDPSRFQYKGDVDEASIRERWRDTTAWSTLYGNRLVVWQDNEGRRWVVDGHQRVMLARILTERGAPVPEVTAIIYHERDTSVAEVRRLAALKNMVEGTGTPIDAAKVLRELDPEEFDQVAAEMGVSNTVVEQASGLKNLSDEAFEVVARGAISPAYAAIIGERIPASDPKSQIALIRAFLDQKPENREEAVSLVSEWILGQQEGNVQQTLFGVEMYADSVWRERARVLSRALSTLRKRKRIFAAVSRKAEQEWLAAVGNTILGSENVEQLDHASLMAEVIERLARQQGPISEALTQAAERARDVGHVTEDAVEGFLQDVEKAVAEGKVMGATPAAVEQAVREGDGQVETLFQEREAGRREAREADVRTAADEAQEQVPVIPAGGFEGQGAEQRIRGSVRGARTRAEAATRRHVVDTLVELAKLDPGWAQRDPTRPPSDPEAPATRAGVRAAAQAGLRETRVRAREEEARRAAVLDNLRHGRERVAAIQRSLVSILRESRTLPEPLRTHVRALAEDLNMVRPGGRTRRIGRMTRERIEPGDTETDPLRLRQVLDAILEGEHLPGADVDWSSAQELRDMKLLDLERLHRRVQAAVHAVRKRQRAGRSQRYEDNQQAVAAVAQELRAAPTAISTRLPGPLSSAVEVLGISSERPEFLLDRVAGKLSRTYDHLWRRINGGTNTQRTLSSNVVREWSEDLRRVGVTDTKRAFEGWLNERIAVPEAVKHVRETWTRAELMSFGLLWSDPYAQRMMKDPDGGMVIADKPLSGRREESDPIVITDAIADELLGLLGEQERRIMFGHDSPVRRLFDRLYRELNGVFKDIHGYDLEKWPSYMPVHIAQGAIPAGDVEQQGSALGYFQHSGKPGTWDLYRGFIQFREGSTKPIALRPLNTEVNAAIRHSAAYVGLEKPLRTAKAILISPAVRQGLRRQGKTAPDYLNRYLQSVAGRSMGDDGLGDTVNELRRNVTVATLASPTVALNQALSLALGIIHVPAKYMAKALGQLMSPREFRETRRRHAAMDPNYQVRIERGFDPDAARRGEVGRQALPATRTRLRRWHQAMMDTAMIGLQAVDQWTVTNVEQAAVLYAMDALAGNAKMSTDLAEVLNLRDPAQAQQIPPEKRLQLAYRYAQWVVSRTQPSHLPENLADMQRRPVMRMFTSFSGYTNVAMNELRAGLRRVMREGMTPEAARMAAMSIVAIAVIGPLGTAMLHRLRDALYDRESDPVAQAWLQGLGAMVYFVRDLQYLISRGWHGGFEPVVMEAMVDVVREGDRTFEAIGRGEGVDQAVTRLMGASSRLAGVPFWTVKNYIGGISAMFEDD